MNITLPPSTPNGTIEAISSKSAAHRILICAAFADKPTLVRCDRTNKDIDATADCLRALGADISYNAPYFHITPIETLPKSAVLDCGESGSTLRFLLPVVPALGVNVSFVLHGRLPERPLSPLYEELVRHGACLSPQGSNPLVCTGKLSGNEYRIRGDVSSQFISGLLFALSLSGNGGKLVIEGKTESAPYIDMTLDALSLFGIKIQKTPEGYSIPSGVSFVSPQTLTVEGDWSNAAFPLCMGAVGKGEVRVKGINTDSHQGDRAVVSVLKKFGADIEQADGEVCVRGGKPLNGICIDATDIPDLVPVLAVVASIAKGRTVIHGAARLRLKESDRISSVCEMLQSLGGNVSETDDGMIIYGVERLTGGTVRAQNDHRIAMSAATASAVCDGEVQILGAECTEKSYPAFWDDIKNMLGVAQST